MKESKSISKLLSEGYQNHLLFLLFFFSSSYLVFVNSKVVGSSNQVQEFKLFTDLVNRCLVTVPTRYPIPFSTADYWTNYEFHNKVKMCLWTALIKQTADFLTGTSNLLVLIQH